MQRRPGLELDWMTGDRTQSDMLGYRSQDQLELHHGQVVADAHTRPTSEWEVGVMRATGGAFWSEALGVEPLRVLPNRK